MITGFSLLTNMYQVAEQFKRQNQIIDDKS